MWEMKLHPTLNHMFSLYICSWNAISAGMQEWKNVCRRECPQSRQMQVAQNILVKNDLFKVWLVLINSSSAQTGVVTFLLSISLLIFPFKDSLNIRSNLYPCIILGLKIRYNQQTIMRGSLKIFDISNRGKGKRILFPPHHKTHPWHVGISL